MALPSNLNFTVTDWRYSAARNQMSFTASGERNGVRFTVVTQVRCRDPKTQENAHLVALLRINELLKMPSASGA